MTALLALYIKEGIKSEKISGISSHLEPPWVETVGPTGYLKVEVSCFPTSQNHGANVEIEKEKGKLLK